jgi:hypothetical protein
MNANPVTKPRTEKWLLVTGLAGFGFGLFVEVNDLLGRNAVESRRWALLGFWFAAGFMVIAGLLERIVTGLLGGLIKVGGKPGLPPAMQRGLLINYAAWFFCGLGAGLGISGLWRGASCFWAGLELLGPGLGLLIGIRLRQLLFMRKSSEP